uniref:Uncharacterized protein n=1 Tax=Strombidium inclinatum TaxID=197538 RepID=A0A7S3ICJ7_9SPIT
MGRERFPDHLSVLGLDGVDRMQDLPEVDLVTGRKRSASKVSPPIGVVEQVHEFSEPYSDNLATVIGGAVSEVEVAEKIINDFLFFKTNASVKFLGVEGEGVREHFDVFPFG